MYFQYCSFIEKFQTRMMKLPVPQKCVAAAFMWSRLLDLTPLNKL